jgi:hypothetical protein
MKQVHHLSMGKVLDCRLTFTHQCVRPTKFFLFPTCRFDLDLKKQDVFVLGHGLRLL